MVFGIPMLSYFDDFGALLPAKLDKQAIRTFSAWCELIGAPPQAPKSEVGQQVTFLVLLGSFPTYKNGMQLNVTLPKGKSNKWPNQIHTHVNEGYISYNDLEKLIGKLCFSQTCLFGKFAREQLRCLYKNFTRQSIQLLSLRANTSRFYGG